MLEELGNDFYGKVIHDYELLECLGEGSFGRVWKAVDKQTGDVVAIKELKKFKCCSWKQCLILREVKALRGLDHPNIVKLKQLIVENNKLYLVMEYKPSHAIHPDMINNQLNARLYIFTN
ncbi:hypothetical protein Syun_018487 [Stephania yunnanensis]|uniref:Protein kinase domain-containing protein n=1 Tax=Stephania yunnanensis TaxID=152371 RepID=A0AAP0ITF3_9MAGN